MFKNPVKPDIGDQKPDIGSMKPDIESTFHVKNARHIWKLYEAFSGQEISGRSNVMKTIGMKS